MSARTRRFRDSSLRWYLSAVGFAAALMPIRLLLLLSWTGKSLIDDGTFWVDLALFAGIEIVGVFLPTAILLSLFASGAWKLDGDARRQRRFGLTLLLVVPVVALVNPNPLYLVPLAVGQGATAAWAIRLVRS